MGRAIIHVDMDAFYASVEVREDPSLRGKPIIVGGDSPRSVVATASYEARRFGVKSAMAMVEAKARCPHAVIITPKMRLYQDASHQVFSILRRFSPLVEPLSLDEAFIDVSSSQALFGPAPKIAAAMREAIAQETRLTASAGVAVNKFVAKIASDFRKPDGLTVVRPGEEARFLAPLPIGRMWGIGRVGAPEMLRAGIRTLGDLASQTPTRLASVLSRELSHSMIELARGQDDRPVVPHRDPKSVGSEITFEEDLDQRCDLEAHVLRQAARVASRLSEGGWLAGRVTLKLKSRRHVLLTRALSPREPVGDTISIHRLAMTLLDRILPLEEPQRLIGVSASHLVKAADQAPTLFPELTGERRQHVENAVQEVRRKFGRVAISQALIHPNKSR